MIITFYDKDFNALQNNASLNVSTWNITRRAIDYDDFTATCEAFIESVNPTYVVMKNDYGNYYYGALAGIPQLNKHNQTDLQASDLKTLFNNEIAVSFSETTNLNNYFNQVFNAFNLQVIKSTMNIEFDISALSHIVLDSVVKPINTFKVYNVWDDCLLPYLKYYDIYIESRLDIPHKKLIFKFDVINKYILPLKAWEFGINNYGKQVVSVNEVQALLVVAGEVIKESPSYILRTDNSITSNLADRDLYPIKRRVFLKEVEEIKEEETEEGLLNEALIEALKVLVEARYNESFTITDDKLGLFNNIGFDTSFNIYVERGKFYKKLPVGELTDNNTGVKTIKIGYKIDDIVFYI